MPTRWHMMSEKQLSIFIQGRNYARGNRLIIRIPRAFACISAGAPWLWRSAMQIDKVSQEPARLCMLTAPFHGTFFPLEVHSEGLAPRERSHHPKQTYWSFWAWACAVLHSRWGGHPILAKWKWLWMMPQWIWITTWLETYWVATVKSWMCAMTICMWAATEFHGGMAPAMLTCVS